MTETVRRFPRSTRVAVVAALLGVVSLVTTVAGAAPSKEDVERARARLEAIEDKLSGIQGQLAATQEQLNAATARVERREAAVEQVTAELILTQEQLDRARASYERVSTRLNERAAAAYMTGPASSIDFLLNAQNVADLTDRIAYVDALAQADAELAVKVANEKNRLVALEAELEEEQLREVRELERARAEKGEVVALFDEQQSLLSTQEQLLAVAERAFKRTEQSYEDWRAEQQASTGDALGGREWRGGSLAPFDHVFEVCPVRQPRAYGDGFGAPRYAGGYHLHKGVDIVAPAGDRDPRSVRRSGVHELERPGRERGVRGGVAGHRVQRAPVEVLRELERRRLGRRGDRLRREHRVEHHAARSLRVPPAHDAGRLVQELLRIRRDRGRDQPVPLAAPGLRLAPPRLLSWSRCDPRTSDTSAWWARV